MKLSRRVLLGSGAAALGTTLVGAGAPPRKGRKPKNVIFLVVDGMSDQTFALSDVFQRTVAGHPSYWADLIEAEDVVNGLQRTRSLNSVVTDSAAASSAWGSGVHIWNGQLNILADGTALRPIAGLVREKGVKVGLVTTTTITHATPAGFAIVSESRDDEAGIAAKYLTSGVDVLMGGGNRFFAADKRKDSRDLYADFAKAGFAVVRDRDALLADKSPKMLGIFSDSHVPFTVDRDNEAALQKAVPTLAEMTRVALAKLKGAPNGFLLQVEGGKVDHGGHANDLAAMVYDQMAFEEAVKVAVEFARADGETLVVITADHACGGASLNGAGQEYIESTDGLRHIAGMKSSFVPLFQEIGKAPTRASVQAVHEARLGLKLADAEADAIVASVAGKHPFGLSTFHNSPNATMAMIHGNHTKVTWTSSNHTHEHVIVSALGPGSEKLHGVTTNIEFFPMLCGIFGVRHTNPTMTFEDAMKLQKAVHGVGHLCQTDHWVA